jgi:tRNA pseudouridine55 synthase
MLLLNKSAGMTSNDALQQAKRLFFAQKAGHTGSLDPLATGVLPVCFGETSKFSQYLLDSDKRYVSSVQFGVTTETSDSDGAVVATVDTSKLTRAQIEAVLPQFRGNIRQVPSMYSSLKHQGRPLYKWAREGVEIPRQAREITIFEYKLLNFYSGSQAYADIEVHCSKGTYIRTL